jgi:glycosyltransferase involved in cell wall biosynthesis
MNQHRKRIGVLGLRGFPHVMGGVERHCEQLYPRLATLGYSIYVCRRSNYLNLEAREQHYDNIKFLDVCAPRNKYFEALFHSLFCVILLKFHNIRILHVHSFGPGLVAPFAKLLGFKVVLTYHLPNYLQGKWSPFDRMLLRLTELVACKFSDEIIAVSKSNQGFIARNTGKTSRYIPNGVHITTGPFLRIEKYGIKAREYVFAACRFVPEKGIDLLIKAFLQVKTNWKLVIAGGADHESEYSRNLYVLAKGKENIVFTGILTGIDLESLFSSAGLFVLPSFIEGQPISLLEAMSHGLPCIISDIEAHKEFNLDERCYFPVGDIETLATKLDECIKDKLFLESGRKYRDFVIKNYNWDNIAEETAMVYQELTIG